ncbi:hypothetical protein [Hyphococcus sp.]|uniref:hypothetical protein n=1 Tax=Hyphococcus sp. TaxID=2038636 RepID=UPI003D0C0EF5
MMEQACTKKDATIVQCLLKFWIKAWNECGEPGAAYSIDALFAKGEDAIDVEVEAFGRHIKARNFDEYKTQWKEVFEDLEDMSLSIAGEPELTISGDRADIRFELVADATRADGTAVTPAPRWRGEHSWRQFDGEWLLVRERLFSI